MVLGLCRSEKAGLDGLLVLEDVCSGWKSQQGNCGPPVGLNLGPGGSVV